MLIRNNFLRASASRSNRNKINALICRRVFRGTTIPDTDFRDVCLRITVVVLQWRIPTNQQNLFREKNGQEHHHITMSYHIRSWSLQPSPVRG